MMLLFLDFDGVLHPEICPSKSDYWCCLSLLEGVLREYPHVEIVISSTWRESRTLDELRSFFSPDIQPRIISATPSWRDIQDDSEIGAYMRQAEVEYWLRQAERVWEPWVAIDDQPWLFKPFLSNLVSSDPKTGLTQEICMVLRQKLQQ